MSIKLNTEGNFFCIEKEIEIEISYVNFIDNHSMNVSISILDDKEVYVLASPNLKRIPLGKGNYKSTCIIPKNFLNKGKYFFTVLLVGNNFEIITQLNKIVAIDVDEEGTYRGDYYGYWGGVVRPYLKWENTQIDKLEI
jgi:lipopolysaccharide transport system ATP-binding protein